MDHDIKYGMIDAVQVGEDNQDLKNLDLKYRITILALLIILVSLI